jgi:hypothetical protein
MRADLEKLVVIDHSNRAFSKQVVTMDLTLTIIREEGLNSATKVASFSRLFVPMPHYQFLGSDFSALSKVLECSEADRHL